MKIIIFVLAVCLIIVLTAMIKSGNAVKSLIISALQGLISLTAVNLIGLLTNVSIPLNWYTISFASLFGLPSVISMLMMKLIFK